MRTENTLSPYAVPKRTFPYIRIYYSRLCYVEPMWSRSRAFIIVSPALLVVPVIAGVSYFESLWPREGLGS